MNKKKLLSGVSSAFIAAAAISLSSAAVQAADVVYGDANCDGVVSIADAAAIFQCLANPDKYSLSMQGQKNADVDGKSGITASDALAIQKYDANQIDSLPEKN